MYSILNKKSLSISKLSLSPSTVFMISAMVVNGGNYLYNIWLGRHLGPEAFAEAGLLLTFLLVLSFAGMTFQLVASKFIIELDSLLANWFIRIIRQVAGISGIFIAALMILFSDNIREIFHLESQWSVIVFAMSIPIYFLLSAERGFHQGKQQFITLSVSYQIEIWTKFIATVSLLYLMRDFTGLALSLAIFISVFVGKYYRRSGIISQTRRGKAPTKLIRKVIYFGAFTLGYELIQILINYGDLLVVKHYFDNYTAGLYTSLAMIGRIIYFIAWMMVMIVIPAILNRKKEGRPYKSLMLSYVVAIAGFSGIIVILSAFFPALAINLLFGEAYLSLAPLLWKYAMATAFFALANLFIYYFISTDLYWPVAIAALAILIQLAVFFTLHDSIVTIVETQVMCMGALLGSQVLIYALREFFWWGKTR